MKSTGIVRRVDELGRIVLPIELRKVLGINVRDPIEIYTEQDMIILKRFQHSCLFCGAAENLIDYKGKHICPNCLKALNRRNDEE